MTASGIRFVGGPTPSPAKAGIKALLRSSPRMYKLAEVVYENSLYLDHIWRNGLVDAALTQVRRRAARQRTQAVLTFLVPFPQFATAGPLIEWLRAQGVEVFEGGHTFYIPPQAAIECMLPEVCAFYPRGSGFKVLKDLRPPRDARYLFNHRRSLRVLARMIGTPQDQLAPANYMHLLGLAPRVWDLACWASPETSCTVFVVEHAAGRAPDVEEATAFLERLIDLTTRDRLRVLIPRWESNDDFRPPACNGNLVYRESAGHAQYLDFQNFCVVPRRGATLATGARSGSAPRVRRSGPSIVAAPLRQEAVDPGGRTALDLACADCESIADALSAGAAWVHGACEPDKMAGITESLFLRGLTRFTLHEAPEAADVLPNLDADVLACERR
jgi:hypothetical protein